MKPNKYMVYERKYFREVPYGRRGGYEKMKKEVQEFYEANLRLASKFNLIKNMHVLSGSGKAALDVGCALGYGVEVLEKHGFRAYGCDISEYAIKVARNEQNALRFHVADIQKEIPFEIKFNLVVCFGVLEHLERPEFAVRNIFRSLGKDGIFIASIPNLRSRSPYSRFCYDPTHINEKTPYQWRRLLLTYFSTVEVRTFHLFPIIHQIVKRKLFVRCPEFIGYKIMLVAKK